MSDYINTEDALAHQEWVADNYVVDLESGRIVKQEEAWTTISSFSFWTSSLSSLLKRGW